MRYENWPIKSLPSSIYNKLRLIASNRKTNGASAEKFEKAAALCEDQRFFNISFVDFALFPADIIHFQATALHPCADSVLVAHSQCITVNNQDFQALNFKFAIFSPPRQSNLSMHH
jgi:hypothetical protein